MRDGLRLGVCMCLVCVFFKLIYSTCRRDRYADGVWFYLFQFSQMFKRCLVEQMSFSFTEIRRFRFCGFFQNLFQLSGLSSNWN